MGIGEDLLEPYGRFVAKVSLDAVDALADRPRAKYIVVTAITPTPLGEGKTTTTIGLAQGMKHIGKRATAAIRQSMLEGCAAFRKSCAVITPEACARRAMSNMLLPSGTLTSTK